MEKAYTYGATRDAEFKDESPLKTVEKIKSILKSHNITTTERWNESLVPYCFSLRVTVDGTNFGTNGKGITKDFALASAYGELMERIQLGYIGSDEQQKDGHFSVNDVQNVTVPLKDLLEKNIQWYEILSKRLYSSNKETLSARKILEQYSDKDGNIIATPFYCVNKQTWEYIPTDIRKDIYSANGCAAGNTPEEAIVQAISEIVERYSLVELTFVDITPPDIPEEVLQKYDVAYSIITFLRDTGFRVIAKDCSLGKGFPVVSICIIDTKTGKYHTHFAANPIFEIALERALTESFQGRSIDTVAEYSNFKYSGSGIFDYKNLIRELHYGSSEKSPRFFVGEPSYQFEDSWRFKGTNNRELFVECINFLVEQGYDVLIRDSSCLGFPTFQVIVPGYSEVWVHRLSQKTNETKYRPYAVNTCRNPSASSLEDKLGFLLYLPETRYGFSKIALLHSNVGKEADDYLLSATLAYVYYSLGKFSESAKHILSMLPSIYCKDVEFLICLKRYLNFRANKYDDKEIAELLSYFHSSKTVEKLYRLIENKINPLEDFVLHCDLKCSKDCILYDKCCKQKTIELSKIIQTKTKEYDSSAFIKAINKHL